MLRPTGLTPFVIGFALLAGLTTAEADDRADCTNTSTVPANGVAACSRWMGSSQLQGDDLVAAHLWRGWHLTASGEFDRAIADYGEAIKRDPKLAAAYMGRAANYEGKGELALALADFRKALSLDPGATEATAAIKRIEGKLAAVPPSRPAAPTSKPPAPAAAPPQRAAAPATAPGDRDACKGEPPAALEACSRLIASGTLQGSALAEIYESRGTIYLFYNIDLDRALADFNEAIHIDPSRPTGYFFRGIGYGWKQEFDRALADLNEGLRIAPQTADDGPWLLRASVYFYRKQDYDRAIASADAGIRNGPRSVLLYVLRSRAYEKKGMGERAAADMRQALELEKALVDAFNRFEQHVLATGNVFWAFGSVFLGAKVPAPAAPALAATAPPPAATPSVPPQQQAAAPAPQAAAPKVATAPTTGCTRSAWRINNASPNAAAQWTVDANSQCRSTMNWSSPTTVTLATAPSHGTLTIESSTAMVYTPNAGYQGDDAFAITVRWANNDGGQTTGNVKFAVTVK